MAHALREEDLAFVDTAPIQVREEVVVAGTAPDVLWPALADPAAWTQWFVGMKQARYTSPEPYGVGTTRQVSVSSMKADEVVLAFDVAERFAFRVTQVNLPALRAMVEVITLEPVGDGTRVVYRQAVELEGWAKFMGSLVRRQLSGSLRKSLPKLAGWVAQHPSPGDAPTPGA